MQLKHLRHVIDSAVTAPQKVTNYDTMAEAKQSNGTTINKMNEKIKRKPYKSKKLITYWMVSCLHNARTKLWCVSNERYLRNAWMKIALQYVWRMNGARRCLVVLPPHHLSVDKAAASARCDSLCRASGPPEKSCASIGPECQGEKRWPEISLKNRKN